MIVEIEGLKKIYDGKQRVVAVDGIDLQVREGELFGVLGPNGAGKTTTISICTTRALPTAGRVRIAGIDVVKAPSQARRSIGVVPQYNTLDRACTIFENIYFHCLYFGFSRAEARQRTKQLLSQFHLSERSDAYPAQLSGGLAQRVQIARAIAHHPKVLFLDEPSAGLDPQSRIAMWDAVRALREEGITVVLTTHYMEEADELWKNPRAGYTRGVEGLRGGAKALRAGPEEPGEYSCADGPVAASLRCGQCGVNAHWRSNLCSRCRGSALRSRSRGECLRSARPDNHRNQPRDGVHPAYGSRPSRVNCYTVENL